MVFKSLKLILKVLAILIIGGVGGFLIERTVVPWLAEKPTFSDLSWFTIERVTVVNPTTEVIIDEAHALERAVGATQPQLVAVERQSAPTTALASTSGIILTSDGIIATSIDVVGEVGTYTIFRERDAYPASLLSTDETHGLALLKADVSGWPVTSFSDTRDQVLGKRVFLMSQEHETGETDLLTTLIQGIVSQVSASGEIDVDIAVADVPPGAAIFTLEGKLLGLVREEGIVDSTSVEDLFEETELPMPELSASIFR